MYLAAICSISSSERISGDLSRSARQGLTDSGLDSGHGRTVPGPGLGLGSDSLLQKKQRTQPLAPLSVTR